MENYSVDPQLLAEFIDESIDSLAPLEEMFVRLDQHPSDPEVIGAIFRPIHSLKGNAAFFGLMSTKELAHRMENVLDQIRQGTRKATVEPVAVLLPGLDMLRGMLERIRQGLSEVADEAAYQAVLDPVVELAESSDAAPELGASLKLVEEKLDALEKAVGVDERRGVREIRALLAPFLPNDEPEDGEGGPLAELAALLEWPVERVEAEDAGGRIRDALVQLLDAADSPETADVVRSALSDFDAFMVNIGYDPILRDMLAEKATTLKTVGRWRTAEDGPAPDAEAGPPAPGAPEGGAPSPEKPPPEKKPAQEAAKTMRVSEESIDGFLEYVGELVVVEEMFNHLQKRLAASTADRSISNNFRRVIETFSDLSGGLRKSILAIRKVPIRSVFQKAPRIVHDVAANSGKQARVEIAGQDLLVDKSHLDLLDAPFTHLVRNAVDHGIEPPEDREQAGKPPEGLVRIEAVEERNGIRIRIAEDGKGIDHKAVWDKAVAIGAADPNTRPDPEEMIRMIFAAGVSTAKSVSDVSGRGVGMDVVRRNVEEAGGDIAVSSKPGEGTTFTIRLPKAVSTQIMDGFLVRAGKEVYVLPMDLIGESFSPESGRMSTVSGRGEMVTRRGDLFPVVRLDRVMGAENDVPDGPGGNEQKTVLISIQADTVRYALMVDEIIGVQKVVAKPVNGLSIDTDLFEGAAMMGDGAVAMIVGREGMKRIASGG